MLSPTQHHEEAAPSRLEAQSVRSLGELALEGDNISMALLNVGASNHMDLIITEVSVPSVLRKNWRREKASQLGA